MIIDLFCYRVITVLYRNIKNYLHNSIRAIKTILSNNWQQRTVYMTMTITMTIK